MKVVVKIKLGYDNVEVLEVEELKVIGDKVKIKVEYSGICGLDIYLFKGEYVNIKVLVILGYEFFGIVVEVGEDVKNIKVGDRVILEIIFVICEKCIYCEIKDYNLCLIRKGIGI